MKQLLHHLATTHRPAAAATSKYGRLVQIDRVVFGEQFNGAAALSAVLALIHDLNDVLELEELRYSDALAVALLVELDETRQRHFVVLVCLQQCYYFRPLEIKKTIK